MKLSYRALGYIFAVPAIVLAVTTASLDVWYWDFLWSVALAVEAYFFGAAFGQEREARKNLRKLNWYSGPTKTVVG